MQLTIIGRVGVSVYYSCLRSRRGRAANPGEASPRSHRVLNSDLGGEDLREVHLPIREDGLGLTSSISIRGTVYIGWPSLVLGRVVASSARDNLPSILERSPNRPMDQVLLKPVVTEVTRRQNEDAVGASWPALVAEDEPQGRGIGNLMVEAGAKSKRGVGGRGRGC